MLKTNVDEILELLRQNPSMSVQEIAEKLGMTPEIIQQSAEYMEEDGLIKIEYKFMKPHY